MSIFAEIESLEEKVQEILKAAGNYRAVDDFVKAYTDSILDALGSFSASEISGLNLEDIVEEALKAAANLINVDLAAQISEGVTDVLAETSAFYTARGIPVPELRDAISRSQDIETLTGLFSKNIASMRQELRDGTIEVMQDELAQGLVSRTDIEELIFQYADGKAHYARTNARLIVSTYNRIGRDQIRESAGLKHGYYYGDARANTRPFCLERIGNIYTLDEIKSMDNGQLAPVQIYAGGWNCIHSWLWVEPDWVA